jgi:hypothetical protein
MGDEVGIEDEFFGSGDMNGFQARNNPWRNQHHINQRYRGK